MFDIIPEAILEVVELPKRMPRVTHANADSASLAREDDSQLSFVDPQDATPGYVFCRRNGTEDIQFETVVFKVMAIPI